MTDVPTARDVFADAFGRVHELVGQLTDGLTEDLSTYRPDAGANSIGWLIWHLSRVQDDHIAEAAGVQQVWPTWRQRFGLPFGELDTGYGHDSDAVGAVRVSGELLLGYHAAVSQQTAAYVESLTRSELERVVDERWDPPVTVSVRLVSVVSDCLQHAGQAAYVRGLFERRASSPGVGSSAADDPRPGG